MNKIPRIIHYCWFGNTPLPEECKNNIQSWRRFCPDYQIMCWNNENFDFTVSPYMRSAAAHNEWAFVSDYARLFVLEKYGGIYLDTDVEVVKSLDGFLELDMFTGLEDFDSIATGLILGSQPDNNKLKDLMNIYDSKGANIKNNKFVRTTCVEITTKYFRTRGFKYKNKLQIVNNCTIFPTSFFCPQRPGTKKIKMHKNTYTIHHYSASWFNEKGFYKVFKYRLIYFKAIARRGLLLIVGPDKVEVVRKWYRTYFKKA